jgi:hypothetical protein
MMFHLQQSPCGNYVYETVSSEEDIAADIMRELILMIGKEECTG